MDRPKVALTMGDVAGVGPELIARAWSRPELHALCAPVVVGDLAVLRRAIAETVRDGERPRVQPIATPEEADPSPSLVPCLQPPGADDAADVKPATVDARAGRGAYVYLVHAIDLALAGRVDAITTLPLNKESLSLAGVPHPGHTEILAERCSTPDHAMMLYLPSHEGHGVGVVHVTLHMALRDVFDAITVESVASKIRLADRSMRPLTDGGRPRIAVASLNPHAGEHGLFGDEEVTTIGPAVELTKAEGLQVSGPFPNDTLFRDALGGKFDAVVAMYHDQALIPLKTIGFDEGVNVTLGLPFVRTSPDHGTAFDIAAEGRASATSLVEALRLASAIVAARAAAPQ